MGDENVSRFEFQCSPVAAPDAPVSARKRRLADRVHFNAAQRLLCASGTHQRSAVPEGEHDETSMQSRSNPLDAQIQPSGPWSPGVVSMQPRSNALGTPVNQRADLGGAPASMQPRSNSLDTLCDDGVRRCRMSALQCSPEAIH